MIPPRKNAKPWKEKWVGAAVCTEALRACQRLGRGIWKKWNGYHRRSLVETKMHCFKRLGKQVMARTFERQVTQLHVRVALLNRLTQLGCPTTVPVSVPAMAQLRAGLGLTRPEWGLCNKAKPGRLMKMEPSDSSKVGRLVGRIMLVELVTPRAAITSRASRPNTSPIGATTTHSQS